MSKSLSTKRILAVGNHPGGINAIIPVVIASKKVGANCFGVATAVSAKRFEEANIHNEIMRLSVSEEYVEQILKRYHPNLVLLGTSESVHSRIVTAESLFISAARKRKIPTLAVLDYWSAYRDRFSTSQERMLDALPDMICVMDERAKKEMIAEGFPAMKLVVTGNPHWDRLAQVRATFDTRDKIRARRKLGVRDNQNILLFVSQPLSEDVSGKYGYTECDVVGELIDILHRDPVFSHTVLLIKPHPREKKNKFLPFIDKFGEQKIKIMSDEVDPYVGGFAADYIVGMFSMLLVEYALLGMAVVSYQPLRKKASLVPVGYGVYSVHSTQALALMLKKYPKPLNKDTPYLHATEEVMKVLRRVMHTRLI